MKNNTTLLNPFELPVINLTGKKPRTIKMGVRLIKTKQNLKNQNMDYSSQILEKVMYEKRYRKLFETAKDGIIILDANNGMIVDVNPFLINLLGYTKEEFLTKHIWDIGTKEDVYLSKQLFKDLQEKEYVRYEDLPLEAIDGKQTRVEIVSNVYLVDNKKVIQCNIRDISDRIRHEQAAKLEMLKKEELVKELHHRTKNSFNLITSLIHLRIGKSNSNDANTILDDLFFRVKSISDLYSLLFESDSFQEVKLDAYCNQVIDSMMNLSENITLIKNMEEIKVLPTIASPIGMIIVELLSNTIKFAFPDSRKGIINIELKSSNSKIILKIEDDGIGLPSGFDINKITSIGLHLVKLLVSQLDGNMTICSENGTKILLEFPITTGL